MSQRQSTFPYVVGGRHSVEWYRAGAAGIGLDPGERFFVPCQGGPCISRLEIFPPRLEIAERDGMYILVDDGPRDDWRYEFSPNRG